MKRWYDVGITRVIVNGKGESVRRNVQHAIVWGQESEALALGFRQIPDPFPEDDRRRVVYSEITELQDNFDLRGRKMETVVEDVDEGSQFGLDPGDLEAMASGGQPN